MIKIFESLEMNDFSTRGPTRLLAEIGDPAVSNSKVYAFCLGLPGRFAPKTARFARGRFNARNNRTQQTHATHARNKLVQRPIRSENTQKRVLPPKTSPIEQISDRFGPKFSPLRRVILQKSGTPRAQKLRALGQRTLRILHNAAESSSSHHCKQI